MSEKPEYKGNSVMVRQNGPFICKGDKEITVLDADGNEMFRRDEFSLCRCGASVNKPFCDGSHNRIGFNAEQNFTDDKAEDITGDEGELTITVKSNAMYIIDGPVTIFSRNGESVTTRKKGALCRCGHSDKKPFCDAKHKTVDFSD